MSGKFARFLLGGALVAGLSAASALVARAGRRPFSPEAPGFRSKGPAGAKVAIVEFSDFQCPACREAEQPLRALLALHEGRIRMTFMHFPLRQHEWARPAAIAAECAGRQSRFWEYHGRLYDRQAEWTNKDCDAFLTSYARELDLDADAWGSCRRDPAVGAAVDRDAAAAANAWVGGTPTFFINGRRFVAARQLAELGAPFVEKELKR
ncbi:MAG: thioredoxin domain-containing protein [Elusimicrobia bacterium]|nr:thioredoxin domain-containing protein [Elusimicrobiota bacterium]